MSQNAWRTLRTLIRYFVYAGSGLVVLFAIMICLSFLMNPFAGFAGQSEFSDLAGHSAKRRLSDWPSNVDPRDVQNVSYKSQYSRDSYSTWYRITLSDNAAERWTNQIHKHQEDWSRGCLCDLHEGLEGCTELSMGLRLSTGKPARILTGGRRQTLTFAQRRSCSGIPITTRAWDARHTLRSTDMRACFGFTNTVPTR